MGVACVCVACAWRVCGVCGVCGVLVCVACVLCVVCVVCVLVCVVCGVMRGRCVAAKQQKITHGQDGDKACMILMFTTSPNDVNLPRHEMLS